MHQALRCLKIPKNFKLSMKWVWLCSLLTLLFIINLISMRSSSHAMGRKPITVTVDDKVFDRIEKERGLVDRSKYVESILKKEFGLADTS